MSNAEFIQYQATEAEKAYWHYAASMKRPKAKDTFVMEWIAVNAEVLRREWKQSVKHEILSTPRAVLLKKYDRYLLADHGVNVDLISRERRIYA